MKDVEIEARFLEIVAVISLRALRQMIDTAVLQVFSRPNFWADQFHIFDATVQPSAEKLQIVFTVADIEDANGCLSPKLTDDQIKALLLPVFAEMLAEHARHLIEREVWLRHVHVGNVNRNPGNTALAAQYRGWLASIES